MSSRHFLGALLIRSPKLNLCTPLLTYLLNYLLTPRCRVLLEQLTGLQLVKKFPAFHGTPKVHYRTHRRPPPVSILGQPNPVHIPTSHLLEIHPNIIHPSTPRSSQWSPINYLLIYLLTHSMVQSPSWAANWFAASQEIPHISRNPKVHYRTHKRPPPVSILGQPNPVHIPTSHLLEIHPNIIHPSKTSYMFTVHFKQ